MHSGPTFGDTKGGRPLREGCCARQLNVAGGSLGVVPGLLFLSFSPAWGMGPLRKGGHRSPTVAWMCLWDSAENEVQGQCLCVFIIFKLHITKLSILKKNNSGAFSASAVLCSHDLCLVMEHSIL